MTAPIIMPGGAAIIAKGWLRAHKWLLLRRAAQLGFLAIFLAGPWAGLWLVKGTLASSLTLSVLPLTDPYILLQSLFAGHLPEATALIGAAIVLTVYALIGGRVYCSWVCPVNPVTDAAGWLRERFGLTGGRMPSRNLRLMILAATFIVSAITGIIAWELVNPVTLLHRAILFGGGLAWAVIAAIFIYDLTLARRGWCGALCPVGAFYGLIGAKSILRVRADKREDCNDCMDCYAVCPEPQVITPALKGAEKGIGPVILDRDCTNCGRCIDVCSTDVYRFGVRFNNLSGEMPDHMAGGVKRAA